MFSRIRRRCTYANVAVTLALVFAMSGGAFAAGRYLITSTKQISPKVLKALQGRAGAPGAPGSAGATGPAGPGGPAGPAGAKGETGASGPQGEPGKNGENGKEGSPWTAGGTLPKGRTLTGEWTLDQTVPGPLTTVLTGVSFALPLGEAPVPHYLRTTGKEPFINEVTKAEEERESAQCPGSAAEPKADPGSLCVYASAEFGPAIKSSGPLVLPKICPLAATSGCLFGAAGADRFGFGLATASSAEGTILLAGSWAVTAE